MCILHLSIILHINLPVTCRLKLILVVPDPGGFAKSGRNVFQRLESKLTSVTTKRPSRDRFIPNYFWNPVAMPRISGCTRAAYRGRFLVTSPASIPSLLFIARTSRPVYCSVCAGWLSNSQASTRYRVKWVKSFIWAQLSQPQRKKKRSVHRRWCERRHNGLVRRMAVLVGE